MTVLVNIKVILSLGFWSSAFVPTCKSFTINAVQQQRMFLLQFIYDTKMSDEIIKNQMISDQATLILNLVFTYFSMAN